VISLLTFHTLVTGSIDRFLLSNVGGSKGRTSADLTDTNNIPFHIPIVTYEGGKRILAHFNHHGNVSELSTPELLLAGGVAGFGAWIPCYPQDVIKSRMQSNLKYKNTLECFRSLQMEAAGSNWKVWFKGFGPTMARAFPANAATFFFYELTMKFMRGE